MTDPNILRRIRSAEMLRRGAQTPDEADVAFRIVEKLLRKYNVTLDAVMIEQDGPGDKLGIILKGKRREYVQACVQATCALLDVGFYWLSFDHGGKRHQACFFYGARANAEAGPDTLKYLVDSCKRLVRKSSLPKQLKADYALGVATRIYQEIERHVQERRLHRMLAPGAGGIGSTAVADVVHAEQMALVVTASENMRKQYEVKHPRIFANAKKGREDLDIKDRTVFEAGYQDGRNVDIHGAQKSRKAIE